MRTWKNKQSTQREKGEKKMSNEYQEKAEKFLEKTGTKLDVEFVRFGKHFADDKQERDIYKVTLTRNKRSYTFEFGQSIKDSGNYGLKVSHGFYGTWDKVADKLPVGVSTLNSPWERKQRVAPNAYDILACLTKYDPGLFDDFCSEYGYDTDSRKAETIYYKVRDEYLHLAKMFNDEEMEEMAEIN